MDHVLRILRISERCVPHRRTGTRTELLGLYLGGRPMILSWFGDGGD